MMRKNKWKWLALPILLIVVGVFMFPTIRNRQIQNRVNANGRVLVEIIEELEDEVVFLNDIVPFEWDIFVVYAPYTMRETDPACMPPYFLSMNFIDRTYFCFFNEDRLVARMISPPISPSFDRNRFDDNLEFYVIQGSLIYDSEIANERRNKTPLPEIAPFDDFIADDELIGMWQSSNPTKFIFFDDIGIVTDENYISAWSVVYGQLIKEVLYPVIENRFRNYSYSIDDDKLTLINEETGSKSYFERE